MIAIETDDAQRLVFNMHEGKDPLGLRNRYDEVTDDHAQQVADDMLAGYLPVPNGIPRIPLDRVACALLKHAGVDPDAFAAIAAAAKGVGLLDDDGERFAVYHVEGDDDLHVRRSEIHAGPLTWHQDATLEVPSLPATISLAVSGTPLSMLVSHPALDPLALVIDRADGRLLRIRMAD